MNPETADQFLLLHHFEKATPNLRCLQREGFRRHLAFLAARLEIRLRDGDLQPKRETELLKPLVKATVIALDCPAFVEDLDHARERAQEETLEGQRQGRSSLRGETLSSSVRRVQDSWKALLTDAKQIVEPPILSAEDISLASSWRSVPVPDLSGRPREEWSELLHRYDRNQDLMKMLSARAAEKAAMHFYQRHNRSVEDVSVEQLRNPSGGEWRQFDLRVDGRRIDIKNARRSKDKESKERYVEQFVKWFKVEDQEEIAIAGVLSRYLWVLRQVFPERSPDDKHVVFLGEMTLGRIEAVRVDLEAPGFLDMSIQGSGTGSFLPPWVFDYPPWLYESRNECFTQLRESAMASPSEISAFARTATAALLAAGVEPWSSFEADLPSEWSQDLYKTLQARIRRLDLSLPVVFLSILRHFLEMLSAKEYQMRSFRPSEYCKLVFFGDKRVPLGVFDPLRTVDALIRALDILWAGNHTDIARFYRFRLSSWNILEGMRTTGRWERLIAYCGGWEQGGPPCGRNPLVLGREKTCEKCGLLICENPMCRYCWIGCTENALRPRMQTIEVDD